MADYDRAQYRVLIDPDTDQVLPYGYMRAGEGDEWTLVVPSPVDGTMTWRGYEPASFTIEWRKNRAFPFTENPNQRQDVHFFGNRFV